MKLHLNYIFLIEIYNGFKCTNSLILYSKYFDEQNKNKNKNKKFSKQGKINFFLTLLN